MQFTKKTRFGISPNSQYVSVGTREGSMVYLNLQQAGVDECVKNQHSGPIVDVQW